MSAECTPLLVQFHRYFSASIHVTAGSKAKQWRLTASKQSASSCHDTGSSCQSSDFAVSSPVHRRYGWLTALSWLDMGAVVLEVSCCRRTERVEHASIVGVRPTDFRACGKFRISMKAIAEVPTVLPQCKGRFVCVPWWP